MPARRIRDYKEVRTASVNKLDVMMAGRFIQSIDNKRVSHMCGFFCSADGCREMFFYSILFPIVGCQWFFRHRTDRRWSCQPRYFEAGRWTHGCPSAKGSRAQFVAALESEAALKVNADLVPRTPRISLQLHSTSNLQIAISPFFSILFAQEEASLEEHYIMSSAYLQTTKHCVRRLTLIVTSVFSVASIRFITLQFCVLWNCRADTVSLFVPRWRHYFAVHQELEVVLGLRPGLSWGWNQCLRQSWGNVYNFMRRNWEMIWNNED